MSKILNKLLLFLKNRLFLLGTSILILFIIVILGFYKLQIVQYDYYTDLHTKSTQRTLSMAGTRGMIYDRNGKILATNKPVYTIYYDLEQQTSTQEKHQLLIKLEKVMEASGDSLIDEVPISKKEPFVYTANEAQVKKFLYGVPYSTNLEREELITYTAEELLNYLKKQFKIDDSYTMEEVRKLIAVEYELYPYSYKQYEDVRLSDEISLQTVHYLEEQNKQFPGISIQINSRRTYPYGEAFSSILGYTGKMTATQSQNYLSKGYYLWEDVGQMGLEKSLETYLHGEAGMEVIEVNQKGQKVSTLSTKEAGNGADVYLTLDAPLQLEAYKSLEKRLSEAIVERLSQKINPLTSKEILYSMIECNTLQIDLMQNAPQEGMQSHIYKQLREAYDALDPVMAATISLKDLLLEGFNNGTLVKEKEILLALNEQKVITLNQKQIQELKNDLTGTTEPYLINLLKVGSLKPSHMAITPSSGAIVIVDVKTGAVLSEISYPTYDNNQMISVSSDYWTIVNNDTRSLLWNRSVQTLKAPGSTFKMLTAIAGLETGVITPEDEILDKGIYEKAGSPYPKCWVANTKGTTHGQVDLKEALAVSCNYYFYEVAMRLENLSTKPFDATDILSYYGEKLGLGSVSGVELEESEPSISNPSTFLTRQIKTALNNYQSEGTESRTRRIQRVKEQMCQGILEKLPLDSSIESGNNDDEARLALAVEPMVQKALAPIYEQVIREIYNILDEKLQEDSVSLVNKWVNKALMATYSDQIETTIKQSIANDVQIWVKELLDTHLNTLGHTIDAEELLDAYEATYTQFYRRLIRQADKKEEALMVKDQLDRLERLKNNYDQEILLKIRQNMINIIVNELLNGVELKWSDGITVRSAIGQGNNAFSPVQIARYIAAIANGKYICDLTLVKDIGDNEELYHSEFDTQKTLLDLKEETIAAIHQGMLAVTMEADGTGYEAFKDLDVRVAAKTGTAEEGSHAHSWFTGFAPAENPEIAIVVTLYDTDGLGSYSQEIAKDLISYYFSKK